MAWWGDERVLAAAAAGLLLVGVVMVRRRARRRHAQRWERWRREHARRLPWELFRRRGATLRLTDARTPPGPGA